MSTPEQHRPPLYACTAGAVLHAHSADTLEPAVILYTFLPAGAGDRLDDLDAKVDVHSDGPGSATLTLRVLSEGQSLSWSLPIGPFVAALPGQPGDEGRMVLLAVMDAEPEEGFWAKPVDCERLAAELQIPVTDLADALRGRLTPWLADDVDLLLHDDAHEHAADLSPAQTLANAVLSLYLGDMEAEQATTRLVRAFDYAPKEFAAELGARLCVALVTAVTAAGPEGVVRALEITGPFEPEVARVLTELPPQLRPDDPTADDPDTAATVVLSGGDYGDAIKAAASAIARLARTTFGSDLSSDDLLQKLSMIDDAGELKLARLWVDLALAAAGPSDTDSLIVADLGQRVEAQGAPAGAWLRATAAALASTALELSGRSTARVATPVQAVDAFLRRRPRTGEATSAADAAEAAEHCLALARFVRQRGNVGAGHWRQVGVAPAAMAVSISAVNGADRDVIVDLLDELLADDVEALDALEVVVCATAQLLVEVDPLEPEDILRSRVEGVLAAVPAKSVRWLLLTALREAPQHDAAATDVTAYLPAEVVEAERLATKAGRRGVLRAGLECLEAVSHLIQEGAGIARQDLLTLVLPAALTEHDMLLGADLAP